MTIKFPPRVRFFWIGEESEVFAAESIMQLAEDNSGCGSGIDSHCDDRDESGIVLWLYDHEGEQIEWGEFDGTERTTIRNCDDDERPLETMTGSLHDIYAWTDGGRYGLPVMLMTQYN